MVTAYILIQTEVGKAVGVARQIRGIPGVAEAEDAVEGTLHHRVLAASVERLQADQVRHFRFDGADGLELSTPPDPDGAVPTLVWRRRTRDT